MDSRRNIPSAYDEYIRHGSEMMHRGPLPTTHHPMEPLPPALLENELASQAAEIEQLVADNRKLASGHLALRQDLLAARGEADKMREHMRSIQNEGDIQVRILLDKIDKREADIRAADSIRKELQEAHIEARSVMAAKQGLSVKVEQATEELEYSRANIKKLPDMHAKLGRLRQEYQRLRKSFEYEKGLNKKKVEQMKSLEQDLIAMAGEIERLRTEVLNPKQRAPVVIPYGGPYMNPGNTYPPPFHGNGGVYPDSFGGPHLHTIQGAPVEMVNPYAGGGFAVGPQGISGPVSNGGGGGGDGNAHAGWGGVYDTLNSSHAQM